MQRPSHLHQPPIGQAREADHDTIEVEAIRQRNELFSRAHDRHVGELWTKLARRAVDETDELDVEFGVLDDLARDQLRRLVGPDDDRSLAEVRTSAGELPGNRPRTADENEGEEPEDDPLFEIWARDVRYRGDDEDQPHARRQ